MPDRLDCLVKTVIGSFPIKDPHAQQRQQRSVLDLRPVDHTEPFSPSDHVGPQLIVKVEVREDVIPPAMVRRCHIFPLLADSMEGVLGDLSKFSSAFLQAEMKRGITSVVVG